ncbi:MAG: 3-deoxy-manno-octulosonate cytidylyltransferase [Proteobacteria bacterium]|nr:3-deoxy-manno-octulosonate cytidylyltransferase [Pseudomonadota bacterium]NOG59457.1 3-deoxy-manno-octulosonate cytidylyltransferase [Pseudomonadota bacterium]
MSAFKSVPFNIVIPARYASTRLPGKSLLKIRDKPLIQHVFETASNTQAKNIVIATDNDEIENVAKSFGANVVMTSENHQSGTDRIAEVVKILQLNEDEIVVNLQGDEYGLPASLVEQVASNLFDNPDKQLATLCEAITSMEDYTNPNVVKVVFDKNNTALYFSRSPVPADRSGGLPEQAFRHIGLYAYRAGYLQEFTELPACELENIEALEQLRVLYNGGKIHVAVAVAEAGLGIDTAEDLAMARAGN